MSRVCPAWFPFIRSVGILTTTGKDRSYRRALRRSDIKLIPHPIRGLRRSARLLLSFRQYYLKREMRRSSPDERKCHHGSPEQRSNFASKKLLRNIRCTKKVFCWCDQKTIFRVTGLLNRSAPPSPAPSPLPLSRQTACCAACPD